MIIRASLLKKSMPIIVSRVLVHAFCNIWIAELSNITKIVRKTLHNLKKMLYCKKYVCYHSSFNKVQCNRSKRKKETVRVKGRICSAEIDFKFNEVKNDTCLKKRLSVIIAVRNYFFEMKLLWAHFNFQGLSLSLEIGSSLTSNSRAQINAFYLHKILVI